ncbi:MAG: adenylate/guanylate cyclase domain-containing protein [Desulfomonile tiedjei]|nr:adenylate/guanylate cyclase domain-containing protein [Desulfomonile tiedjei]
MYFTFIRSGLSPNLAEPDIRTLISYFVFVMILVSGAAHLFSVRYYKRLWLRLSSVKEEPDPQRTRAILDSLLNVPFNVSALSLLAWLAAGVLFGVVPEFWQSSETARWYRASHVFFGIVFVGAPFTVVFLYFVLEWLIQNRLHSLFPSEALTTVPRSLHLNVLPKIILVSLLIGIVPVTIISYVTLGQIHQVRAGEVDIGSFIAHMPVVIAFLLSLAVLVAVGLSVFVAKSISEPLRQLSTAMRRIRKGDLDVNVPVVSSDEIGRMTEGFNRMVGGLRERDFIRDTFGSYLSPEVVSEILSSPAGVNLGGEQRDITILVADLRGFTALTANVGPDAVVKILNRFLEKMVDIIVRHGGTIDEFTGDGILAFFGAPRVMADAPERALRCSIEMQNAMSGLNDELHPDLTPGNEQTDTPNPGRTGNPFTGPLTLQMGIAINKGRLIVGNIGCEQRRKYGAVGTPINVAFRIENIARAGEILVSEEVYESIKHITGAHPMPGVQLKGIDHAVTLYSLIP